MSRSKRKTPICGNTTADSDRVFKSAEHRRERRAVRANIAADSIPSPKAFGNPWAAQKDGKHWFNAAAHPGIMRK